MMHEMDRMTPIHKLNLNYTFWYVLDPQIHIHTPRCRRLYRNRLIGFSSVPQPKNISSKLRPSSQIKAVQWIWCFETESSTS